MATFQYIAKDSAGNEQRGTVEAGDRGAAIAAVRAQGLLPTALGEVKSAAPAAKAPPKKGAKGAPKAEAKPAPKAETKPAPAPAAAKPAPAPAAAKPAPAPEAKPEATAEPEAVKAEAN